MVPSRNQMLTSLHIHDVSNTFAWRAATSGWLRLWCWWLFARSRLFGASMGLYTVVDITSSLVVKEGESSNEVHFVVFAVWFRGFMRGWVLSYTSDWPSAYNWKATRIRDVGNRKTRTRIYYGIPNTFELTWYYFLFV